MKMNNIKHNICVIAPNTNEYSETFIRDHVERLPANVHFLYGGYFPKYDHQNKKLISDHNIMLRGFKSIYYRMWKNFSTREIESHILFGFL